MFFKDKKVLVTGGTGMIGRMLVQKLIDQGAKVPPTLGGHGHADQLMVVPAALRQLPKVRLRHLEISAALSLGKGPRVHAAELDHQPGRLVPAPLDVTLESVQKELGGGCEAFREVRQGQNLDGPFDPERANHLTDSDHR